MQGNAGEARAFNRGDPAWLLARCTAKGGVASRCGLTACLFIKESRPGLFHGGAIISARSCALLRRRPLSSRRDRGPREEAPALLPSNLVPRAGEPERLCPHGEFIASKRCKLGMGKSLVDWRGEVSRMWRQRLKEAGGASDDLACSTLGRGGYKPGRAGRRGCGALMFRGERAKEP